jgi:hypothetical protein
MTVKRRCPLCHRLVDGIRHGRHCPDCGARARRPEREPRDGESYDRSGNIRPVPPGVGDYAEEVADR